MIGNNQAISMFAMFSCIASLTFAQELPKHDVDGAKVKAARTAKIAIDSSDVKAFTERSKSSLKSKSSNLQYDSDHPEAAPWNQSLDKTLPNVKTISVDDFKQNLDPTSGSMSGLRQHQKLSRKADSVIAISNELRAIDNTDGIAYARVYSKKAIQHLYDSLGSTKADSVLGLVEKATRSIKSKDELLDRIKTPLAKANNDKFSYDEKTESINSADAENLQGLPEKYSSGDFSKMQLPPELLSELAPLKASVTDNKYLRTIDSLRGVRLKNQGLLINEQQITEEVRAAIVSEKKTFLDKSYFEVILGFVQDTSFTIVQVSPSWAYNFSNTFSMGVGPNISVSFEEKQIKGLVGFRTYAKVEILKQRAYFQVEDNVQPTTIRNRESLQKTVHSFLVGGGGLVPITKKLAINVALFYRLNQQEVLPGGNPWVIRLGVSSIKSFGKEK
jgi:hypothetical protein